MRSFLGRCVDCQRPLKHSKTQRCRDCFLKRRAQQRADAPPKPRESKPAPSGPGVYKPWALAREGGERGCPRCGRLNVHAYGPCYTCATGRPRTILRPEERAAAAVA